MNILIPQLYVKQHNYCPFERMALALNNPQRLLNKETNPNIILFNSINDSVQKSKVPFGSHREINMETSTFLD